MTIVTNFRGFPRQWQSATGERGASREARNLSEFISQVRAQPESLALVNCDPRLTLELGAAKAAGALPSPLISVDIVLRAPSNGFQSFITSLKKPLLRQVDLYIHYFRDYRRLAETFGMAMDSHEFVPFKVNLGHKADGDRIPGDGEYVLCFGRSLRDYDTFFEAAEKLPYPCAISRADPVQLRRHHARFTRAEKDLPANVTVLDDDGSEESQVRILGGARIVVLPILSTSLVASGISTCLNAMRLSRCVIGTEGPGMSDVFGNEMIVAPPENPAALAASIRRVWEDDDLRVRTAEAGHAYAMAAGGEQDLYARIIERLVVWYRRRQTPVRR